MKGHHKGDLPRRSSRMAYHGAQARVHLPALAVAALLFLISAIILVLHSHWTISSVDKVQRCAIENLHADLSFLDDAKPIDANEFLQRHDRLAAALAANDVDAFVLEPGYTSQYYANISQTDWEPWEPEERPFLMIIMPDKANSKTVTTRTAFLAPHFEEGRARMLGIPSLGPLEIVVWEEHWNPYTTLRNSSLFSHFSSLSDPPPRLVLDEELRDFIGRGLDSADFQTVGLSQEVELVKQIKSQAEVEILRAVNTGTVAAVRAMRPCLKPGLTEDQVRDVLDAALLSVGFSKFFNIVLFEEHAALPHGGFVTGSKKLDYDSMVVIDVGAHYLGYSSDICRSFFINPPRTSFVPTWLSGLQFISWFTRENHQSAAGTDLRAEKLRVWNTVLKAQTAAASMLRRNNSAASVDIAARQVIQDAGYGAAFTHRVGHGIGIKAHESPYLNKWNTKDLLQPGMVFTNEPGIYLEGRFGVRHEDIYLVNEHGGPELLTGARAKGPYEP